MKWLYKYPQRAYPYQQLIEENRRRRRTGTGVRAARHRHLRRRPLLRRRSSSTPRRRPRTSSSASRSTIAVPSRADPPPPASLVPQHMGLERAAGPGADIRARTDRSRVRQPPGRRPRRRHRCATSCSSTASGRGISTSRRAASCSSPTTRRTPQRVYGPGAHAAAKPYVKDAFHRHIVDGEERDEPGATRHQGLRPLPSRRSGRRFRHASHAPHARRRSTRPLRRRRRGRSSDVGPRRTSSMPRSIRRAASEDERMVQRQAFAGLLWTKQIYLFDVNQLVGRRRPVACRRPRHDASSATATGDT